MQVILASKSPRRKDLLVQVGMDPLVMDSYVEEVTEALSPETLVRENAARKGRKVAAAVAPDALVIAADTVVAGFRSPLLLMFHLPIYAASLKKTIKSLSFGCKCQ